jgi:SAM-dependent methyltransferase
MSSLIAKYLPPSTTARLHYLFRRLRGTPAIGKVNFGDLRRLEPISDVFGLDRGLPIDRVYVERFLESHAADIQGAVLEIAGNTYTSRFGGTRVGRSEILDVDPSNRQATLIADLADAPHIADNQFDAIILTQTLQLIFDVRSSIHTLHRLLKPGGVLLVTVPGISSLCRKAGTEPSWCWAFTAVSLRRLIQEQFGTDRVTVKADGNILAAISFLEGLSAGELEPSELDSFDPDYPVIVSARAVKSGPDE